MDFTNIGGLSQNVIDLVKMVGYAAFDILMIPFRYVANMNEVLKACILGFLMAVGFFILLIIYYQRRKVHFVKA